jgi:hypothetical protein
VSSRRSPDTGYTIVKILNRKMIGACIIAAVSALNASAVTAGAILFNGGLFEVTVDNISGKTADFVYTADFTNWNTQGEIDYIFAVDFKLSGYTVVDPVTMTTDATGTWTAGSAKNSNANGCGFSASKSFACAGNQPFVEAPAQAAAGILTWNFAITFDKDIVAADLVAPDTNHIGAFFQRCEDKKNGSRKCKPGFGLSTETTFDEPGGGGPPTEVPVPGTLFLLSLGLLGLRFRSNA